MPKRERELETATAIAIVVFLRENSAAPLTQRSQPIAGQMISLFHGLQRSHVHRRHLIPVCVICKCPGTKGEQGLGDRENWKIAYTIIKGGEAHRPKKSSCHSKNGTGLSSPWWAIKK